MIICCIVLNCQGVILWGIVFPCNVHVMRFASPVGGSTVHVLQLKGGGPSPREVSTGNGSKPSSSRNASLSPGGGPSEPRGRAWPGLLRLSTNYFLDKEEHPRLGKSDQVQGLARGPDRALGSRGWTVVPLRQEGALWLFSQ